VPRTCDYIQVPAESPVASIRTWPITVAHELCIAQLRRGLARGGAERQLKSERSFPSNLSESAYVEVARVAFDHFQEAITPQRLLLRSGLRCRRQVFTRSHLSL
jgi:DNA-directed RNA polymerase specialized sigma24 family protein